MKIVGAHEKLKDCDLSNTKKLTQFFSGEGRIVLPPPPPFGIL